MRPFGIRRIVHQASGWRIICAMNFWPEKSHNASNAALAIQ